MSPDSRDPYKAVRKQSDCGKQFSIEGCLCTYYKYKMDQQSTSKKILIQKAVSLI